MGSLHQGALFPAGDAGRHSPNCPRLPPTRDEARCPHREGEAQGKGKDGDGEVRGAAHQIIDNRQTNAYKSDNADKSTLMFTYM